jgi:hypothetical protein
MRLSNWPKLLTEAINAAQSQPFAWGSNDCCLFAAGCAQAITGVDAAATLRGTYSTEAEAEAIIAAAGGFEKLVTAHASSVGWRRSDPYQAGRGDLVSYAEPGSNPALGVCCGSQCAFLTAQGIRFVPLVKCSTAWRVN